MRMKAILVLTAAIAFAAAPFQFPEFRGFDPDLYPVPQVDPLVQPAGYAFGIWGVIYLWLLGHAGYGLFARADDAAWDATRWPMIVSLVIGAAWLGVALTSPLWATLLIWVMLVAALAALFPAARGGDRAWLALPVGLYAGWLTAASWVAIGLTGAGYGIGPGQTGWAVIGLAGAIATAAAVQWRLPRTPSYGIAAVWALVAVVVRNFGTAPGLAALAALGALALAGLLGWQWRLQRGS